MLIHKGRLTRKQRKALSAVCGFIEGHDRTVIFCSSEQRETVARILTLPPKQGTLFSDVVERRQVMSNKALTQAGVPSSDEVLREVARISPRVLLGLSGKDSVALLIRALELDCFEEIIPYRMVSLPCWIPRGDGTHQRTLSFVEEGIRLYERQFGLKVRVVPHYAHFNQLTAGLYQTPNRMRVLQAGNIQPSDVEIIRRFIIETEGLPPNTYTLIGTRAADSPDRRTAITKAGPIRATTHTAWGIWDYTLNDVITTIERAGIQLSPEYRLFKNSLDGIDARFIQPIAQYMPEDFEIVRSWFPLCVFDFLRYETLYSGNELYVDENDPRLGYLDSQVERGEHLADILEGEGAEESVVETTPAPERQVEQRLVATALRPSLVKGQRKAKGRVFEADDYLKVFNLPDREAELRNAGPYERIFVIQEALRQALLDADRADIFNSQRRGKLENLVEQSCGLTLVFRSETQKIVFGVQLALLQVLATGIYGDGMDATGCHLNVDEMVQMNPEWQEIATVLDGE